MKRHRVGSRICMAAVFALVAAAPVARGACNVNAPEGWSQAATRWDGDCVDGFANGLGVLKELDGRHVKRLFFGTVVGGELQLGVIDQADGYVAGRFAKGSLIPSDDRQTFISAFAEGEKAADSAARRYRQAGNKASAKFYQDKAKALREQMD